MSSHPGPFQADPAQRLPVAEQGDPRCDRPRPDPGHGFDRPAARRPAAPAAAEASQRRRWSQRIIRGVGTDPPSRCAPGTIWRLIAVDASVLVHAHRTDSPHHFLAAPLVAALCRGPAPWAIPWPSLHEFLVLATHPRGFGTPTSLAEAFATVDHWRSHGNLRLIGENEGYLARLGAQAAVADSRGARIYDARIAALCLHHGVHELWSAERGFRRFPQLVVRNPLQCPPPPAPASVPGPA